jgi:uncharacterized protein
MRTLPTAVIYGGNASGSVSASRVFEEKLIQITSNSEKLLYHRVEDDPDPHFHSSIDDKRLRFAFEGTRDNQLFLTNSVSQKRSEFKHLYDWFSQTLVLIAPDTRFERAGKKRNVCKG